MRTGEAVWISVNFILLMFVTALYITNPSANEGGLATLLIRGSLFLLFALQVVPIAALLRFKTNSTS